MSRPLIVGALVALLILQKALTIELLANYKYWKSAGEELSYDYSGNSRHGRLNNVLGYNATDRGLMSYNYYEKNLMAYAFPSRIEYTTSLWLLSHALANSRFSLYINYVSGGFLEYRNRFYSTKTEIYTTVSSTDQPLVNLSPLSGWNLHTIRFYIDQVRNGRVHVTQYLNLNSTPFYSTFYDTGSTNIQIKYLQMRPFDSNSPKKLILYELWVHTGFTSVSELSYLASGSICPPPSTACLPSYTIGCGCSSVSPCDSRYSCVNKTKAECKFGLYDIATSRCIFYCPFNSCTLPTALIGNNVRPSFAFSCIAGYTKISDNPPACMSVRCLSYQAIDYEYFCDIIEYGYSLNSNGECCVCKSGFDSVSSSPTVCVNTSVCSGYSISGANYTCSSCAAGYVLNSTGKCILKIDNCSTYTYDGNDWICQICNIGYSVDSNGNCSLCSVGYTQVSSSPFTCTLSIDKCITYTYNGNNWICQTCNTGYSIDSNSKCDLCSVGYAQVSSSPFTCTLSIESCSSYIYNGSTWICQTCNFSYSVGSNGKCSSCGVGHTQVLSSPLTCAPSISNCDTYTYDGSNWICQTCNIGYSVDSNGNCSLCSVGYTQVLSSPFTCAPRIDNCSTYTLDVTEWICQTCNTGYKKSVYNLCDECETGYVNIDTENLTCVLEILYCIEYQGSSCLTCSEGYFPDLEGKCKCADGYFEKQTNPLKCAWNTLRCDKYLEGPSLFTCISCEEGYSLDSSSKLCICDTYYGYKEFESDPIKCGYDIFRCDEYLEGPSLFDCIKCEEGYSLDSSSKVCTCDTGYVRVADSPYECAPEIEKCNNYIKRDQEWICDTCSIGYKVDPYGKCVDCDAGYSMVSTNPFICEIEIYGCVVYGSNIDNEWICEECGVGYDIGCERKCCECDLEGRYIEVSQSPKTCIMEILNCLKYQYYETFWGCSKCNDSYDIDSEYKCNKCHEGYATYLEDPLTCIPEIKSCEKYTMMESDFICSECNEGFRICQGRCCECDLGYYVSKSTPEICSECPSNCSKCKEIEDGLDCTSCIYGYTVVDNKCECDDEDFYYKDGLCVDKTLEVTISNDYNSIIITFSKALIKSLQISDLTINFHQELDNRLLKYELIDMEYNKSYLLSFTYSVNINQVFDISIIFSDTISDRQNQKLDNKVIYASLSLHVEGITGRSEYCDSSCSECKLNNGRLECSICFDYAYIFEGLCKCFDESVENSPESCPAICPTEMKIDLESKQCISCDNCYDEYLSDENEDSNQQDTKMSNSTQILGSKGNQAIQSAAVTSISLSILSFNVKRFVSMIGTIQILSFILLYNLNIPSVPRSILEGISQIMPIPNIFEYFITYDDTIDIKRYSRVDISNELLFINAGEILTTLIVIFFITLILKLIRHLLNKRPVSQQLLGVISKLLSILEWNFIIGYLIQATLELTIYSLINIYHVSIHSTYSVVGFCFSMIVLVIYI